MSENNSNHNSFYSKENTKDKNINNNFDWKKYLKISGKVFKWMLFIFLAITTLWGCVQEFTIKSSPYLSQGVETYRNEDEVLPNLYYLQNNYSYVNIDSDADGNTDPFANIMYPVFKTNDDGVDFSSVKWYPYSQAKDINDSEGYDYSIIPTFSKNASILDTSVWTYLILFPHTQINQSIESNGKYYVPFYQSINDGSQITGKWSFADSEGNVSTEETESLFNYSSYDTSNLTSDDYKYLANVDKAAAVTNLVGFYRGESVSASKIVLEKTDGSGTETIQQFIDDNLNLINDSSNITDKQKTYYQESFANYKTIDYNKVFAQGDGSQDSVHGVNYWVVAQNKNQPLHPSQETYDYLYKDGGNGEPGINEIRSSDWKNSPVNESRYDSNEDSSVANAGWLFMDQAGNRISLIDPNNEHADEEGNVYLQAQTLSSDLGDPSAESGNIEDLNNSLIAHNAQSKLPSSDGFAILFDDYQFTPDEQQTFDYIGFSSIDTIQKQSDEGTLIVSPTQSIGDVPGQKSTNSDRIAISSWGEAWTYGPFYGMFVYPISMLANLLSQWIPYETIGAWSVVISVFIIVFLFRGLASIISLKSTRNQQKMQEIQIKVAQINAKYDMYKDNKNMKQRKQLETMALYKKEGVNPLSSLGSIFLTLPIFLAMWTIISTLPLYKIASFGPMLLAVSPFYGIFHLFFQTAGLYLVVAFLVGMVQYVSFKLPNYLAQKREGIRNLDDATKKQMKKSGKVTNIMLVVFVIIGLTIPTLLSLYWIFSSLFTIMLTLFQHYLKERKAAKVRQKN